METITAEQIEAEGKALAERIMAGDVAAINEPTLYSTAIKLMRNYDGKNAFIRSCQARERQSGYKIAISEKQAAAILNFFVGNFPEMVLSENVNWS